MIATNSSIPEREFHSPRFIDVEGGETKESVPGQ
jgi:hypothetical protein